MNKQKQKTKAGRKFISLLLTAAMFFTLYGIPVLAETAGETAAVKVEEAVERTAETREMPKNPVHNCTKKSDGTDTTAWSYVYFGSYPQTEVTGDDLTAAITGASYDANGDAWVNGTKYRRISKSDTNYDAYFGDSTYRYFKWERIKWRVLNVNNSTMFVVADKGLDCKDYHDPADYVTWETCTLRIWLNNDFYRTAFSSGEQGAVVPQTVMNEDNPYYNIEGGNDTADKVYLLSLSEVMDPDYGFCEDYSTYSVSRRVKASDYAYTKGGNRNWWLRSPGNYPNYAASIGYYGDVYRHGDGGGVYDNACVPALHINLSSDLWSIADDGTGDGTSSTGNLKPGGTAIKSRIKAKSRGFLVKWKKQTDVTGYQIQYSTNKKFKKKGTKLKTVKKPSATKLTVKKLKSGKKYYVRIRTYKTVNGTTYYSDWSKVKTVKIKR